MPLCVVMLHCLAFLSLQMKEVNYIVQVSYTQVAILFVQQWLRLCVCKHIRVCVCVCMRGSRSSHVLDYHVYSVWSYTLQNVSANSLVIIDELGRGRFY